jgi:Leu/Phe-tRNA-protein transferase
MNLITDDTFVYNSNGDILVTKNNDPDKIIDTIISDNKFDTLERGVGLSFSPRFLGDLMFSGFYITSDVLNKETISFDINFTSIDDLAFFPLLNLWKTQTVLFFENLHISKTTSRIIKNYELRINYDFTNVLDNITETHGDLWVTPPLKEILITLNQKNNQSKAISFQVYKNGELKAGEIGIKTGKIYTSYSGFYHESSAGSVQLAMMLQYLKENNYDFCNFGTDSSKSNNEYKKKLGATYIDRLDFVNLWREGRVK